MVAYVGATGGRTLQVLNGGGQGGSLLDLAGLRPEDLGGTNGTARNSDKVRLCAGIESYLTIYLFDVQKDEFLSDVPLINT